MIFFIWLTYVIIILLFCRSIVKADDLTIVADEWYPYNGKEVADDVGYGVEIVKNIFEKAGHTILYKVVPWNRAIMESREGKYNGIIGAFKYDAPDFIFPEEELGISETSFFVKKGTTWKYTGLESLLSVQIGIVKDYSYGEVLDSFFKANSQIVQYVYGEDPLLLNINKLLNGRFDVLIEDTNVLLQKVKKLGISDQIIKAGNLKEGDKVYVAFSPAITKSGEYAETFTKGIKILKNSGYLEKILTKYGLKYWK